MRVPPDRAVTREPAAGHGDGPPLPANRPMSRPDRRAADAGGGGRTLLLALVLGVLAVLWVVQDEVLHPTTQVGTAVPPIPALAVLLLLAALGRFALRRRRDASREPSSSPSARILFIYLLITVAAAIPSTASMSFFFAF